MIERPWGKMWTLFYDHRFWIKYIFVLGRTSLQSHGLRKELHIKIDYPFYIRYIPKWKKHRMEKGRYIEFAWGYPMEEDITRYEDDYGRK